MLFIVPTVVEAVPVAERDRVLDAYTIYRRFDGDFRGKNLLEKPTLPQEVPAE